MEFWIYLAIAAGMVAIGLTLGGARDARRRRESVRLAAIDRKLQQIMDHIGIIEPEPHMPEVIAHLEHGRKVKAVKAYQDATGADLAGAKGAVERIARDRGL